MMMGRRRTRKTGGDGGPWQRGLDVPWEDDAVGVERRADLPQLAGGFVEVFGVVRGRRFGQYAAVATFFFFFFFISIFLVRRY